MDGSIEAEFAVADAAFKLFENRLEGDFVVAFEGSLHLAFFLGGVEAAGINLRAVLDRLGEVTLDGGLREVPGFGDFRDG